MWKTLIAAASIVAVALPFAASAHHSAAEYDLSIRDHYVTGIVKEFKPANPHTKIVLEVTDEKGARDIEFEGHSQNNFYRSGWRVGLVKVGDEITVQAAPPRDGSDGGYVLGVIAADGTKF
ncbi:MAG TPA: DUF6152 family protein [Gammaproteobacteria bacterium]